MEEEEKNRNQKWLNDYNDYFYTFRLLNVPTNLFRKVFFLLSIWIEYRSRQAITFEWKLNKMQVNILLINKQNGMNIPYDLTLRRKVIQSIFHWLVFNHFILPILPPLNKF